MSDRRIDLDGKPRAVVELQLGGRTFRISRVVTGVRRLYGELLKEAGEALEKVAALGGTEGAELERVAAEIEDLAVRKERTLAQILELLLTRNGYEYDGAWWEANADESDIKWFIVEALNKDAPADEKKSAETWVGR